MTEYKEGEIAVLSRPYNPMKTDARDVEMLMMEMAVNGNKNKKLKDFIKGVQDRKNVTAYAGGLSRIFTISVIIKTSCQL